MNFNRAFLSLTIFINFSKNRSAQKWLFFPKDLISFGIGILRPKLRRHFFDQDQKRHFMKHPTKGCSIFSESFAADLGCSVGDCPYTGNDIRKGFARSTTHELSDVYFACTAASTTTTTRNVLRLFAINKQMRSFDRFFVVDFQPILFNVQIAMNKYFIQEYPL